MDNSGVKAWGGHESEEGGQWGEKGTSVILETMKIKLEKEKEAINHYKSVLHFINASTISFKGNFSMCSKAVNLPQT